MAVPLTSRYRPLGTIEAPDATGRAHAAVPIRRQAPEPAPPPRYRHRVTGAEDIEYLAWRVLGASDVWWRIADANPVRFPLDLRPGDAIEVPSGGDLGQIQNRERTFR